MRPAETKLDGLEVIQARSLRDALEAALKPGEKQREASA